MLCWSVNLDYFLPLDLYTAKKILNSKLTEDNKNNQFHVHRYTAAHLKLACVSDAAYCGYACEVAHKSLF